MNRPLRTYTAATVKDRPPHVTASGRKLHDPDVFAAWVLPRWGTIGAGRTALPTTNGKPRKRAKR